MAKWVCSVCGYVHEGDEAPEVCPVSKAPASKFTKQDENLTWAAEHVVVYYTIKNIDCYTFFA